MSYKKLTNQFPKQRVAEILKVLPMFNMLDPQFQAYIFSHVKVEGYKGGELLEMED